MKKILTITVLVITISLLTTTVFAGRRHHHGNRHDHGVVIGLLGGILLGNLLVHHRRPYNRSYYRYRNICTYQRDVYEIDEYGDRYYLGTETIQRYCR